MQTPAKMQKVWRLAHVRSNNFHVRHRFGSQLRHASTELHPRTSSEKRSTVTHSTVDPYEVSKFSAQAADWWHPNGSAAPLHRLNPVRMAYIRSVIEKHCNSAVLGHQSDASRQLQFRPLNGVSALDVGCGGKQKTVYMSTSYRLTDSVLCS